MGFDALDCLVRVHTSGVTVDLGPHTATHALKLVRKVAMEGFWRNATQYWPAHTIEFIEVVKS